VKAWKKTSPELVAAFHKALPPSPRVTRRPMFGYASAFVNGNMFAGTFQDAIVVRLAEGDRVALLKVKGAAPFEPMGRPMKEYVVVPASVVATPKALSAWIERGHRYALALPAKSTAKSRPVAKAGTASTRRKQTTAKKMAAKTAKAKAAQKTTAKGTMARR
jgi:TfoX/Sxy family transcriptional regulator of competence genes